MQKKLFLILFGMIALISFSTAQTFGQDGPVKFYCKPALPSNNANWSSMYYELELGDKIVFVNDQIIHNQSEFRSALSNCSDTAILGVIDVRTHRLFYFKAWLWPQYNQSRLGIHVNNSYHNDGVIITDYLPNSPARRCLYLKSEYTPKFHDGAWWY